MAAHPWVTEPTAQQAELHWRNEVRGSSHAAKPYVYIKRYLQFSVPEGADTEGHHPSPDPFTPGRVIISIGKRECRARGLTAEEVLALNGGRPEKVLETKPGKALEGMGTLLGGRLKRGARASVGNGLAMIRSGGSSILFSSCGQFTLEGHGRYTHGSLGR